MVRLVWLALAVGCSAGCVRESSPDNKPTTASKTSLTVAAASDLKYALEEMIAEFERRNPQVHVEASYGSSGNLFAQLSNRAPFDLFLSADVGYPRQLVEKGAAIPDSLFSYAVGQIAVWIRRDSPLDVEGRGIQILADPAVRKIAIANPRHAPYGRAAEAAMRHFDVYEAVKDRLVFGENVAQAAQFVESGAADAGIIALSLALALGAKGRYWLVPADAHPPIEQGGVILARTAHLEACRQFRSLLISKDGREIFKRYGFLSPEE
jgi:molybdate transport system substrate-binding protein